jgi:cytochrome c oxidase subunit 2
MKNYLYEALKVIVVLSFIGGLIFLNTDNSNTVEPDFQVGPVSNQQNTKVKQFNMIVKQFEFSPKQIKVSEGDTVRLTIKNLDVAHGFAINDFNINQTLPAKKTTTFEFVAGKKGVYRFYCSVVCGSGHLSMVGQLIVE